MQICIIGTGYVGLVQGVVMSEFGMHVICVDIEEEKINMLNKGMLPIYEPGLKELMDKNVNEGRLKFSTNMKEAIETSNIIFLAVGTPEKEDGNADLTYVFQVAECIGKYMNEYKVIVDKSTVPVGTGKKVHEIIQKILSERKMDIKFDVVSNPEFLREGKAVKDCLTPDRVVIGTESEKAKNIMRKVYDVLYINQTPFLFTNMHPSTSINSMEASLIASFTLSIETVFSLSEFTFIYQLLAFR